tara:strand:+ start:473 stop:1888 length:1416 start_codon:yes stop_codon:yes gene_type:complete
MATETTPINWFSKIKDLGTDGITSGLSGLKNIKLPSLGDFGLTDEERAFQLKQVMDQGQRFNAENSARLQAQREPQAPPINIQRPTFPIMGNASMYQIPNRNFTWQTTPMEQARLAGNMGRPDLSGLLSTGEYGPLAGQQYQYQGGNTMINYGPGGGYGGGYGFNPWGDYGSNPWGDWTPPDWTPPDWTPPDDPTYRQPHIDGTPPTVKPFDPAGVSEFHEQLRDDNERIRERNRLLDIYRDPASDINVDFGFEDRKSWATRGGNPVVNRANVLQDQALAQANHAKQQAALAQQEAQARVLQAQAQAHRAHQIAQQDRLRQALGFGVPSSALGGMPTGTLSNRATPDRELANMGGGSRPVNKAPALTSTGPSASDIRRQQEADAKREAEAKRRKTSQTTQRIASEAQARAARAKVTKANKAQATRGKPSENLALKAMKQAQARKKNIAREESLKKAMGSKNYAAYIGRGAK